MDGLSLCVCSWCETEKTKKMEERKRRWLALGVGEEVISRALAFTGDGGGGGGHAKQASNGCLPFPCLAFSSLCTTNV